MTTVGLVGAGRMGGAMARALRAAGHELVVWNRTPDGAQRLADEVGATTAATARPTLAAGVEVSISMLADGAAVDAVYGGPDGLVAGAGPGTVLVDCSTVPPAALRGHADGHPRPRRRRPRRPGVGLACPWPRPAS